MFDHNRLWRVWKQWRKERRRAGFPERKGPNVVQDPVTPSSSSRLGACSNSSKDKPQADATPAPTATPEPPKEIALSKENIEEYLAFNFDYSKVKRETKIGISFGYTDLTTNVYATAAGSFNNAKITMKIYLSNGWSVASSDEAYNENNSEVLTLDFRLPANGSFTETHDLIAAMVYSDPNAQHVIYTITSVSGTFIPQ